MATELTRREALAAAAAGLVALPAATAADKAPDNAFNLVVCDPLAAPLSCTCAKGYAQRDYDQLGTLLQTKLGRPVMIHYAETLYAALARKGVKGADLVIGKDSWVRAESAAKKLPLTHVASLTGQDGKTTQKGIVVVPSGDAALQVTDLKGYTTLFGPTEAEERHAAAFELFKDLGVDVPAKPEISTKCSAAAAAVLDRGKKGEKVAAVISEYCQPLLVACGTVKKADLRMVGETDPVAFIGAFVSNTLPTADREVVAAALLAIGKNAELCAALETKTGFVAPEAAQKK
jgi:ABC-type phosphate/phosphonate transport system substrate-binding protein